MSAPTSTSTTAPVPSPQARPQSSEPLRHRDAQNGYKTVVEQPTPERVQQTMHFSTKEDRGGGGGVGKALWLKLDVEVRGSGVGFGSNVPPDPVTDRSFGPITIALRTTPHPHPTQLACQRACMCVRACVCWVCRRCGGRRRERRQAGPHMLQR